MEATKQQSVYFWGLFNGKQYPLPERVKQLEGKGAVNVSSGGHFYLAVTENGLLYGWGSTKYSRFGILGEEVIPPKLIPLKTAVKFISAGNWHSMFIDNIGKLYSAGHNKQGACGSGTFENIQSFTQVKTDITAKAISCGDCYSLVISNQNDLYSCGHGDLHGHKTKENLNKLKKVQIGAKIKTVAAGFTHSLAVSEGGQVYSWGNGSFNQLGHGDKKDQKEPRLVNGLKDVVIVGVSCTRGEKNAHSMALGSDGSVYTWGAGYKGKLGHASKWSHEDAADEAQPRKMETIDYPVSKVSAGGIHSNILNQNGEVLSFGCGSDGRLGHSKSNEYVYLYRQGIPKAIDSLKPIFVTNVESSYYHNICLGYKR